MILMVAGKNSNFITFLILSQTNVAPVNDSYIKVVIS